MSIQDNFAVMFLFVVMDVSCLHVVTPLCNPKRYEPKNELLHSFYIHGYVWRYRTAFRTQPNATGGASNLHVKTVYSNASLQVEQLGSRHFHCSGVSSISLLYAASEVVQDGGNLRGVEGHRPLARRTLTKLSSMDSPGYYNGVRGDATYVGKSPHACVAAPHLCSDDLFLSVLLTNLPYHVLVDVIEKQDKQGFLKGLLGSKDEGERAVAKLIIVHSSTRYLLSKSLITNEQLKILLMINNVSVP